MKKTIMSTLDEMAKRMSKNEVNRLYESKVAGKYGKKKMLDEAADNTERFSVTLYADDFADCPNGCCSLDDFKNDFIGNGCCTCHMVSPDEMECVFKNQEDWKDFRNTLSDAGFDDKMIDIIYGFTDADSYMEEIDPDDDIDPDDFEEDDDFEEGIYDDDKNDSDNYFEEEEIFDN